MTPAEKQANRKLAGMRVRVEHALAGIKICRITKDTFRNSAAGASDLVMTLAAGLHNLRRHKRRYRHTASNAYFG